MPYGERERRIRMAAKQRGIERIRTVNLPDGKYAHVYIVRGRGSRGGHSVMGEPQRKRKR